MTPDVWIDECRAAIRGEIVRAFSATAAPFDSYDPLAADLHQTLRDVALRSSGLGAVFLLVVVRSAQRDWERAAPVAATLDLLAAATLVADDVIDEDDMRWGAPTVHARYREIARAAGRP